MSFQNLERLEALHRPNLGTRAAGIALEAIDRPDNFELFERTFFRKNRSAAKIGRYLQKLAVWVEPVDSTSGSNPLRPRKEGFKQGVFVGLWLAADLYQESSIAKKAMKKYAKGLNRDIVKLEVPDPNDRAESIGYRGLVLQELGWRGAEMFEDLSDFINDIADEITSERSSQITFHAGTGLGLLTAMEGFYAREMRSMTSLVDSIAASTYST